MKHPNLAARPNDRAAKPYLFLFYWTLRIQRIAKKPHALFNDVVDILLPQIDQSIYFVDPQQSQDNSCC